MQALTHTFVMARRNLLHIRSDPEQIAGMTLQPVAFLLLFVYVLGGAIAGSSRAYLQFALPGQMVLSTTFTAFATGVGLADDFQRGLVDRFRSLPMAPSAVIGGRVLADSVRVLWGILILLVFGILLGFRFQGGPAGAVGAVALSTLFGVALCFPMAYIGVLSRSRETAGTWAFLVIFPIAFASTIFASADRMPAWLSFFVKINPVTEVAETARALMLGGSVAGPLGRSLVWMAVIALLFGFLAVERFRRRA